MSADFGMKNLEKIEYESWIPWKIEFKYLLYCHGVVSALTEDKPSEPTDTSPPDEKAKYEEWERSNSIILSLMESNMADYIYEHLSSTTNYGTAKEMFAALEGMVMDDEKLRAPCLLKKLANMRYDGQGDVMNHLSEMGSLARRLKAVNVHLPKYLISKLQFDSLPSEFGPVKLAYAMAQKKWGLLEISAKCRYFEDCCRNS